MSASLSGVYNLQCFTDAGAPLASGRLYTYTPSTTTLKTAYTDEAGSIAHTYVSDGLGGQYIALNTRGELPAPLFLTSGGYDITLKTPAGVTVWTRRAIGAADASLALDTALRADLASKTDAAKGSGLNGHGANLNYATGTVGAHLYEAVVTDYPWLAVDDDATDNYAAIAAAITWLVSKGGGRLVFPIRTSGVYRTKYAIPIRSNIHYAGAKGVVLKASSDSWDNIIGEGNNLIDASIAARAAGGTVTRLGKPDFLTSYTEQEGFVNGGYNGYARTGVKFTDLIFDGNKDNCTENQLNLVGASVGTFLSGENLTCTSGGTGRAVYVYAGTLSVEPKSMVGAFTVGATVTGATSGATMVIGSKQADDAFQAGLRLMNVSHAVVRDCEFRNMVFIPLSIYDYCNDVLVEDCFFHDNNKAGTVNTAAHINIYVEYFTQSVTIQGCDIVGGLGYSVACTGIGGAHRDLVIDDLLVYNPASDGIRISNDSGTDSIYGVRITNNTVTGCTGVGSVAIRLNHGGSAGGISEAVVESNTVRDALNGILFQGRVSNSTANGNTLRTVSTVAVDTTSATLTNNSSFNNRTDSGTLLEDGQTFIGSQYVRGGTTQLKGAKSISVTGATTIYTAANNNYQTMLVVSGDTGAAGFSDIIIFAFGTISTVHSSTRYGAPSARTYTAPGAGVIQLAMAAGTYSCKVSALENQ